jgi:hypothetical protein
MTKLPQAAMLEAIYSALSGILGLSKRLKFLTIPNVGLSVNIGKYQFLY